MLKDVALLQHEAVVPLLDRPVLFPMSQLKGEWKPQPKFLPCCRGEQEQRYLCWRGGTELSASCIVPRRYRALLMGSLHLSLQSHLCKCHTCWWGFASTKWLCYWRLTTWGRHDEKWDISQHSQKTDFKRLLAKTKCISATGWIPCASLSALNPSTDISPPTPSRFLYRYPHALHCDCTPRTPHSRALLPTTPSLSSQTLFHIPQQPPACFQKIQELIWFHGLHPALLLGMQNKPVTCLL